MPDAVAVSIAKAVVTHIQTAIDADDLSQEFELERSYGDWDMELKQNEFTRVDVDLVTTKQEAELATRAGKLAYTVPIDLCIRRRFGNDKQDDEKQGRVYVAEVDGLMLLVEELHELFLQTSLTDPLASMWKEDPKILTAPVPRHLKDMKQFVGIIRLTFVAYRAV